jgi:periplasmic protein CpxP/Spy
MNKKLATLALTVALSGFGSAVAFAQDDAQGQQPPMGAGSGGGRRFAPQDPAAQVKHLQSQLGLSADQANQLLPILTEARSQQMAVRQDSSLAGPDRMAKMQSIRQDTDAKVAAVLTPDQQTKYKAMRAEMMQRGPRGGGPGGPPPGQDAPTAPPQ